jgi:hypothetical protein
VYGCRGSELKRRYDALADSIADLVAWSREYAPDEIAADLIFEEMHTRSALAEELIAHILEAMGLPAFATSLRAPEPEVDGAEVPPPLRVRAPTLEAGGRLHSRIILLDPGVGSTSLRVNLPESIVLEAGELSTTGAKFERVLEEVAAWATDEGIAPVTVEIDGVTRVLD